jgi:hypothetical protein
LAFLRREEADRDSDELARHYVKGLAIYKGVKLRWQLITIFKKG